MVTRIWSAEVVRKAAIRGMVLDEEDVAMVLRLQNAWTVKRR